MKYALYLTPALIWVVFIIGIVVAVFGPIIIGLKIMGIALIIVLLYTLAVVTIVAIEERRN